MSKGAIPDGVYVGFTYSGFQGDPFTHNFIAIIHDGVAAATLEYGPDAAHRNAPQRYGSRLDSATYGFTKVNPPPGMSEAAFEKRIIDAAKRYDAIPEARYPSYNVFIGANCENMASGLLKAAGVSQAELERIAEARLFGSIDPHINKPFDLPSFLDANSGRVQGASHALEANDIGLGSLHVIHRGVEREFGPGYQQQGRILKVDGDRVVQQIKVGETAEYSRQELLSHANPIDRAAVDQALRPGNNVQIGLSVNGGLNLQQELPSISPLQQPNWVPVGVGSQVVGESAVPALGR